MHETDGEVRALQALLDRSHAGMGPHMRSILTPERRLPARQVVGYLPGITHVALATVTATGEPRVVPLDALFIRGRFHVGTGGTAVRARHLRRRPQVSVTHFAGDAVPVRACSAATIPRPRRSSGSTSRSPARAPSARPRTWS